MWAKTEPKLDQSNKESGLKFNKNWAKPALKLELIQNNVGINDRKKLKV